MQGNVYLRYGDIIKIPPPISFERPHMSLQDRAAQFAPFAALNGYDESLCETARITEEKPELGECEAEVLNRKLLYIESQKENPTVTVLYFLPDELKSGGRFAVFSGNVKRLDRYSRALVFADGTAIELDMISDIICNK